MKTCEQPLYIEVASGVLVCFAALAIVWGLCALFFYAGYGWQASRKKDK